jgi:hypothetical protein
MNEFGVNPKVGINFHPDSHSEVQTALFHDMGFEAMFFGVHGIVEDIPEQMFNESESHFLWNPMQENFGSEK